MHDVICARGGAEQAVGKPGCVVEMGVAGHQQAHGGFLPVGRPDDATLCQRPRARRCARLPSREMELLAPAQLPAAAQPTAPAAPKPPAPAMPKMPVPLADWFEL